MIYYLITKCDIEEKWKNYWNEKIAIPFFLSQEIGIGPFLADDVTDKTDGNVDKFIATNKNFIIKRAI